MSHQLPYKVDYAKSNRAKCKHCQEKIPIHSLRLATMVQTTYSDEKQPFWYHKNCFFKYVSMYPSDIFEYSISGFTKLEIKDQKELRKLLECLQDEGEPSKKKQKRESQPEDDILDKTIERQNDEYYKLHNILKDKANKNIYIEILEANDQYIPKGKAILDHVTDVIYFGAIKPCEICNVGKFIFDGNYAYECTGHTQWAKCNQKIAEPERQSVNIPEHIQGKYPFLAKEFKVQKRAFRSMPTWSIPQNDHALRNTDLVKSKTIILKDGKAVDTDSELENIAHVHCAGELLYSIVLTKVDIVENKNSYYKMQLLQSDRKVEEKYWVFRSWGRIGFRKFGCVTIGSNTLDKFDTLENAQCFFKNKYGEKTGNSFGSEEFIKHPGKYYKIDIEYDEEEQKKIIMEKTLVVSYLTKPIQNLIGLIFDEDMMKQTMLEFNLDIQLMPLGKISSQQVNTAMKILNEILELIKYNSSSIQLGEASNRFYTMIPHDLDHVPIIDTSEMVAAKFEMLEAIGQIADSYKFLNGDLNENKNILDYCYEQLNADIEPIKKNSEEYNLIETYTKNTHSRSHNFQVDIDEIFRVSRKGEDERYEPFKKYDNKKLLWHGSRLSNFVGILSNGMKISPTEVPVTGHMFGKGIYFSDTMSKTANYCKAHLYNDIGLLVICEVALGNSMECFKENYIESLPMGIHSVKGVGKRFPDPKEEHMFYDDVKIPMGKLIEDATIKSELLHNEYIVYDEAQVKMKYLIKVKFSN